jgi:hypothetical protein
VLEPGLQCRRAVHQISRINKPGVTKLKKTLLVVPLSLALLAGCSTTATDSGQKALHYKGGATQAESFESCVGPGERVVDGSGDKHYKYPLNQRKYVYDDTDGADRGTIEITTKDGIPMTVSGITNFVLNTDCEKVKVGDKTYKGGVLQVFHEFLGKPREAYFDDNSEGPGWGPILDDYIGRQLQILANTVVQSNGWTYDQLFNDAGIREEWQKEVEERLPAAVNRNMETDLEFFKNYVVSFDQPQPPQNIKNALLNRQRALAEAETAEAKADAAVLTAKAKEAQAKAEAATRKAEIEGYGSVDAYLKAKAIQKGINPWQPSGAGVMVQR